ncbi:hypothetical protein ACFYZ4_11270 [Streptomyces sp. NPDC001513]|uniref:hypothetical protein n=1 Tax=Streptomyces sp. NPDC001513 TaxID=3364580 RepID=UPI0036D00604
MIALVAEEPRLAFVDRSRQLRDIGQEFDQSGAHRDVRDGCQADQEGQGSRHGRAQVKNAVHQDVAQHAQGLGAGGLIEEPAEQDRDPSGTTGNLRPVGIGAAHKRGVIAFGLPCLRILAEEPSDSSLSGRRIHYAHPTAPAQTASPL